MFVFTSLSNNRVSEKARVTGRLILYDYTHLAMRTLAAGLVSMLSLVTACGADSDETIDPPLVPSAPIPTASGEYASRYRVPVTADLATAADYAVAEVDWTVTGSTVTLHYDLPVGLVGGDVDVTLTGTLASGATSVELSGAEGTGTCVATATHLICREEFTNLGQLPVSMAVVEQAAAVEYAGPVADRVRIASQFASDPIGIVELDLSAIVVDDRGGDD